MNYIKRAIVFSIVIATICGIFTACNNATIEVVDYYPNGGTVIEVNTRNDEITIEDFNGNLWVYVGAEDWTEGDACVMIMSNAGTIKTIYDDEIIQIRCCEKGQ